MAVEKCCHLAASFTRDPGAYFQAQTGQHLTLYRVTLSFHSYFQNGLNDDAAEVTVSESDTLHPSVKVDVVPQCPLTVCPLIQGLLSGIPTVECDHSSHSVSPGYSDILEREYKAP